LTIDNRTNKAYVAVVAAFNKWLKKLNKALYAVSDACTMLGIAGTRIFGHGLPSVPITNSFHVQIGCIA
jgi:hypothetical protein